MIERLYIKVAFLYILYFIFMRLVKLKEETASYFFVWKYVMSVFGVMFLSLIRYCIICYVSFVVIVVFSLFFLICPVFVVSVR